MMNLNKARQFILFFLTIGLTANAQEILTLSRQQCEAIFLKENLQLLAEKLEISKAEAAVLQARLWPNPTFEIDEVNLWATKKQLAVFGDDLQGFNGGNFGKNQQFSLGIEQLIKTAGKRKKLVALEQVTADKSKQYFEDVLRGLKLEFRNNLTQLQHLQLHKKVYEKEITVLKNLTEAYQKQVTQGHVSKGEYIRLKALELEFSQTINDLTKAINEEQKELKILMRLPAQLQLALTEDDFLQDTKAAKSESLESVLSKATSARPDLKIAQLNQQYANRLLAYEKAQRTPDVTLKAGYDRGGNFMYNFVGFGLSIDLPLFDRNQGNIKSAKFEIEQAQLLYEEKNLSVQNEIAMAFENLDAAIRFYESIEPGYERTLNELLQQYTKNFVNRNISMLEYLDFLDAYLENKKIILEAGKEVNEKIEELNHAVGSDLN